MGYMKHHAIIVTSCFHSRIVDAHKKASEIFARIDGDNYFASPDMISDVTGSTVNAYYSFAVFPDGSKEGWDVSNNGDMMRAALTEYLETDGYLEYVVVEYGGDDPGDARVLKASG